MKTRTLILAATMTGLSGCYSWRSVSTDDPRAYMRETTLNEVRLIMYPDERALRVKDWTLVGEDSIRGTVTTVSGGRTVRPIALDDILRVYRRRFDPLKTIGAGLVAWGVVSVVWIVVAFNSYSGGWLGVTSGAGR